MNYYMPGWGNISPEYFMQMFGGMQQPQPVGAPVPAAPEPAPTPTPAPVPATPTLTPPAPSGIEAMRTDLLNQAGQKFGTNYGRQLIGDNLLDNTINSILGEQKGNAQTYLDRGKARGIFNDIGYGAGLNKINTTSEAASSQLAALGGSVIDKYRGQANAVRDKAYSSISGLLPDQQFSFDPYLEEGSAVKANAEQRAGGDLRTSLGGTNFFDFGNLSNTAGMAQGAQNLRDADVATALAERKRKASADRGLGSQGAF